MVNEQYISVNFFFFLSSTPIDVKILWLKLTKYLSLDYKLS